MSGATEQPAAKPVWPAPRELTHRDGGFPLTPVVGLVTSGATDAATEKEVRRIVPARGLG